MYSTIDGRLTPTAPVYEDMRMETPLQVTPEGSQGGLSAAMGGTEDVQVTQQLSDKAKRPISNVTSPVTEVPETSPKVIQEGLVKMSYLEGMMYQEKPVEWMLWQQQDVSLVL